MTGLRSKNNAIQSPQPDSDIDRLKEEYKNKQKNTRYVLDT